MATIDNLDIKITSSASGAVGALDRLASSANNLRGAATGAGGGCRDLAAGAKQSANETQNAGTQAGKAEPQVRHFGQSSEQAGKAAKRGTAGIATFWQALKRVAYYRFIRTIIKSITSAFKEGITAVYSWSKSIGGSFATNMDSIRSSVNLLKGSLGALAAPLLESLTPAINGVINVLIEMINAFNIAIAAINGQDTYTMAVRGGNAVSNSYNAVANSLGNVASNAEDAKKAMRSILGFDEINKLQAATTTSGGGGSSGGSTGGGGGGGLAGISFVEKPLEGIWKKISDITDGLPDWLKWLLTGTALVGGFKLISWLIDKIKDFISNLFGIHIPDWIKWLFGPKGDDNPGIDIPDHIDIPDADIDVNLNKGDWSVLDDIKDIEVPVKPSNSVDDIWTLLKNAWDALGIKELYVNLTLNQTANGLWKSLEASWGALGNKELFVNLTLNQTANGLWKSLEAAWGTLGNKELFVNLTLNQTANGLWKSLETSWVALGSKELFVNLTLNQTANGLWKSLESSWGALGNKELFVNLTLNQTANGLWKSLETAWKGIADKKLYIDVALNQAANGLWKSLEAAWKGIANKTFSVSVTLGTTAVFLWNTLKTAWDAAATALTVKVKLEKDGWTDVDSFLGFGGASGGGGQTGGGGAGRYSRRSVPIALEKTWEGTPTSALGLEGLSATVAIGLSLVWAAVGILAYLALTNLKTDVTVGLVKGWDDTALSALGIAALSTTVTVNLVKGWGNESVLKVLGVDDSLSEMKTTVHVDLKREWGSGSALAEMRLNKLKTSVNVSLKRAWGSGSALANMRINKLATSVSVSLKKTWSSTLDHLGLYNLTAQIKVKLVKGSPNKIEVSKDGNDKWELSVKKLGGVFAKGMWKSLPQFANGGVLSAGFWRGLPKYASGTTNAHGSMFLAGEAGPELVGHLGGRTEVLNQSQLAATMFSAVRAAMNGVKIAAQFYSGASDSEQDYDTMYRAMYDAFTAALAKSDARDAEKVALLRQINAKEFTAEVTANSIANAQRQQNRRAGTTVVPVMG